MKLQNLIVGVLLAGAFITGTTLFIGDLVKVTNTPVNASYNGTYDKIDEMLNVTNTAIEQVKDQETTSTGDSALQLAAYPILKIVSFGKSSYETVTNLIADITEDLSLPGWVGGVLLGLISCALLFAIISALFGRDV